MEIIENLDVYGFKSGLRGMRNPKNSWNKLDSEFDGVEIKMIGKNDLKLLLTLLISGPEHRKVLRMIHADYDATFTRALWSEYDTYHFNTKNSCSTMHKLLDGNKVIDKSLFLYDPEDEEIIEAAVKRLEYLRQLYNDKETENKNNYLIRAKRILPEGFLQMRTVSTNYEELLTMYHQRKNHRMPEWKQFCKELKEKLPYMALFIAVYEDHDLAKEIIENYDNIKDTLMYFNIEEYKKNNE